MVPAVLIWWCVLCFVAILNAGALAWSGAVLTRRRAVMSPDHYAARRRLFWLSAAYVLGCGFRSVLPLIDVPRLCLFDPWLSRVAIGRSVATLAELCFIAQWALLAHELGAAAGVGFMRLAARLLVPLIVIAEFFSWYAVLTRNNLAHLAENSLWTLSAMLLVAGFYAVRPHFDAAARRLLAVAAGCGAAYIIFMLVVDLPMYFLRWHGDAMLGLQQLSLLEGLHDVSRLCSVSHEWEKWREEIPWMTLYFTVGVWFSIALVHLPRFGARTPRPAS